MKPRHRYPLIYQIYVLFTLTIAVIFSAALSFYFVASDSLTDKESNYMSSILERVVAQTDEITKSIELVSYTISDAYSTNVVLSNSAAAQSKQKQRQVLSNLLTDIVKSNKSISNIIVLDTSERVWCFSGSDYSLPNILNSQYNIYSSDYYADGFTGLLTTSTSDGQYYAYRKTIYEKSPYDTEKAVLGTCIVVCNLNSLQKILENANFNENSHFILLDANHQVLIQNQAYDTSLTNSIIQCALSAKESIFTEDINGKDRLFISYPSQVSFWQFIVSIQYDYILENLTSFRLIAFVFLVIIILGFGILGFQIIKNMTSPLSQIVTFIKQGSQYALKNRINMDYDNEIGTLALHINTLLDEIDELTHTIFQNQAKMYEIELANNRSQFAALQSQINPHFLYNTLDAVIGLSYLGRYSDICTTINALSSILRYSLKGNSKVTVKQELACTNDYVSIMKTRFSNKFSFEICVEENAMDCLMPRFILQPLLENAVFHGLEPRPQKGFVSLKGFLDDNSILHFECKDNGIGITAEKLDQLQKDLENCSSQPDILLLPQNSQIGLLNIHMRIQLMYGAPFGLSIASTQGEGTTIYLSFPTTSTYDSSK